MKTALTTTAIVIALLAAIGVIYVYSGSYNVAASEELEGLTHWVFETTTVRSIERHAEPIDLEVDSAMIREGARHFSKMCVMCHGAPGVEAAWVGKGLTPDPPQLSEAVTRFSTGELHWILVHGIKHSGMPALAPTHGKKEIHALVAFIEQLPTVSPEEYRALSRASSSSAPADTARRASIPGPG